MQMKWSLPHPALAAALMLACVGCRGEAPPAADPARPPPATTDAGAGAEVVVPDDALGRAGPVVLGLEGLREAIAETRILQQWHGGQRPPLDALSSPLVRRRVLTRALETRVVREEARKRGIVVPPDELGRALRAAAAGRRPDAAGAETAEAEAAEPLDLDLLDAQLAARYEAPAAQVRQVVTDVLVAGRFVEALLDDMDDAALQARWALEETRVRVDVVRISRVPTAREIDEVVRTRQPDIARYYRDHPRLFNTPERAVVKRIFVRSGDAPDGARARAEALRARVADGEDFEAVARAESEGPQARAGGHVGGVVRERLPEAFDTPVGELTPVREEPEGWAFYRVEGRTPAVTRPLDDQRVQREIGAALLREGDQLPHARRVAEQARALLRSAPDGDELTRLVATERLRRHLTEPFNAAGARLVPGLGLADELFPAIFALRPEAPVTAVFTVRQDYVVARLVERTEPDSARWPEARAAFRAQWRARERPHIVETWLNERLKGEPMWVDMDRLKALPADALDPDQPLNGGPGTAAPDPPRRSADASR